MTTSESLHRAARAAGVSAAQVALVRRTVGRACTDAEFEEFMAVAVASGLDPIRRQIRPLILRPHDWEARQMVPWTTIDGLRAIAARQGDYRPMETAPTIEREDARVDERRNPLGIVRAEVTAWKYRDQTWFPVCGEAWWDEYAPMRSQTPPGERDGANAQGDVALEPSWARMGRVMIAKCAEAQALRRGWPETLSGIYGEEELHAIAASPTLRPQASSQPAEPALWFWLGPTRGIESIPRSEIDKRLKAFLDRASPTEVIDFVSRNGDSLKVFWDWEPGRAFAIKCLAEERTKPIPASTAMAAEREA